jgi:hypothetical protein
MRSLRPFASIVFFTAIVTYTLFGALGIVLGPFELGSVVAPFAQRFAAFALTVTPLVGAALFVAYVFETRRAATAS